MTTLNPQDDDLHTARGGHKDKPPKGMTPAMTALWDRRLRRHLASHAILSETNGGPAAPARAANDGVSDPAADYERLSRACARPLGRHFADLAKLRGLAQRDLAYQLGMSAASFYDKLGGRRHFSLPEALWLSRTLGVNLSTIVDHLYKQVESNA